MKNMVRYLDKIRDFLSVPLLFLSVALCVAELSPVGIVNFGLLPAVLFALTIVYSSKRLTKIQSFFSLSAVALLIFLMYYFDETAARLIAGRLSGKGALFGAVRNVYSLFFGNMLEELVYHTQYSKAILTNGGIVSGAVDIFQFDTESPNGVTASLLTGRYFENIFLPLGAGLSVFPHLEKKEKLTLASVCLLSVLAGDSRVLSLFLLLVNPLLYVAYLAVIFSGYLVASLLDLRIGFTFSASLSEAVKYVGSPVYFLLTGAVLAVLMYFLSVYILTKFKGENEELT